MFTHKIHRVSDGADIVPFKVSRPAEGAGAPEEHRDDVAVFLQNPVTVLV